jgi:hypothetical protein
MNRDRRRDMGPPLRTGEQEAKYGVETSVIPCSQEVQTTTVMQVTDANILFGYEGTYSDEVPGTW